MGPEYNPSNPKGYVVGITTEHDTGNCSTNKLNSSGCHYTGYKSPIREYLGLRSRGSGFRASTRTPKVGKK